MADVNDNSATRHNDSSDDDDEGRPVDVKYFNDGES